MKSVVMKNILIITLITFFASCKDKPGADDLHYPIETAQAVLVDLYVASEAIKDVSDNKKDSLLDVYKSQIEQIHNIEFDIIESDIAIIRSNDALYSEVHNVVNDSINFMDQAFKKISTPKKIRPIPSDKVKKKPKPKKQFSKDK